jgi:oligopeptide transport system ATP-binding protein
VREVFREPRHPYTTSLIASTPKQIARQGFVQVGGTPPDLYALPPGCAYQDRCPKAQAVCSTPVPAAMFAPGHRAICHFPG